MRKPKTPAVPTKNNLLCAKINGQFFVWSLQDEMKTQLSKNISFFEAATIFSDPFYLELPANREEREFRGIGMPEMKRHLIGIRYYLSNFENNPQIHILSAWVASDKEIALYEQNTLDLIEKQSYTNLCRTQRRKKRKEAREAQEEDLNE